MRNLLLGVAAMLLAVGGFGLSPKNAQAADTNSVHGWVYMNDADCEVQVVRDNWCGIKVHREKFQVIVSKFYGPNHTNMRYFTKFTTDDKGYFSFNLPPGEYRLKTLHAGDQDYVKGMPKDIKVEEGSSQQRMLFHYLPAD